MPSAPALVTLVVGPEAERVAKLTRPFLAAYARRHGLELATLKTPLEPDLPPHYGKYRMRELFASHDRLLYVDADVLIHPEAPNLLPLVPQESLGAYLASRHSRVHDEAVVAIQEQQGNLGWEHEYFNSGVLVLSQRHARLLDLTLGRSQLFKEQTQLNYNARRLGIPIHDIGHIFNHVQAAPDPEKRVDSHFIHYAGPGHREGERSEQIAADLRAFTETHPSWAAMPKDAWAALESFQSGQLVHALERRVFGGTSR